MDTSTEVMVLREELDELEEKMGLGGIGLTANLTSLLSTRSALREGEILQSESNQNIDKECGYLATAALTPDVLKDYYERFCIATRVVEIWPMECWKVSPDVFETQDAEITTPFEKSWNLLSQNLENSIEQEELDSDLSQGEVYYKREEGSIVWEKLKELDIRSGIGYFGGLMLGFNDIQKRDDLEKPVGQTNGEDTPKTERLELRFLQVFDDTQLEIVEEERDESSPRFGMPTMYSVQFQSGVVGTSASLSRLGETKKVHWSRILHVADGTGSNLVGTPRMRPVWNRLHDLRKIYGGSGENMWNGGFAGMSIESHPSLGTKVSFDKDDIAEQMASYRQKLSRYLLLKGAAVNSLSTPIADPAKPIEVQIDAICIVGGYPKRIFMGSERGQLSSEQDARSWNGRLAGRQNGYLTPRMIVPFIKRLIRYGILERPTQGFGVKWPDMNALTLEEKINLAFKATEALAKYIAGDVNQIITEKNFLTKILWFADEEAEAILEDSEGGSDDDKTEE